jgi:hypothetical protein
VAQYTLYSFDGPGSLGLPEEILADNDQDAISKVREMKPGALQCEVWERRRLVISLQRQDLAD